MITITEADDKNHLPESLDDIHWQESFVMLWYDPVLRLAGSHHAGLQRVRGIADVWSWATAKGRVVEKFHNNEMPLPDDDYSDIHIGPFHLKSDQPLTHRTLIIKDEDFSANLKFVASSETIGLTYDTEGSAIASGHWENFGHITGTVVIEGETHEVKALAFQDRSWGARDWGNLFAYRWNWASFGDDLILSVYKVTGINGTKSFGHVFDHGEWRDIRDVEFVMEMASDGLCPVGSRAEIWMPDGSGYSLHGKCDGSSMQTHRDGFMMANACVRYTLGGRLGTGFMEVSELKRPNNVMLDLLAKATK